MVWCGDSHGYTSSFTPSLDEQSSFQAPPHHHHLPLYRYTKFHGLNLRNPIIKLANHQRGVLSLLNTSISFNSRRGPSHALITEKSFEKNSVKSNNPFQSITCMTLAHSTSNDLIVGGNNSLFKVDLNKPSTYLSFSQDGGLSFINYSSKLLTLGRSSGALEVFDPVSDSSVKLFSSNNGLLSDIDVKGNYVATCGYSARTKRFASLSAASYPPVEYVADPLINIYDLRMMRALLPLPFPAGASFVRFHPKLPNVLVAASTSGQIQFLNMFDQLHLNLYQADLSNSMEVSSIAAPKSSYLSNLEISESGEYMCFSDDFKTMHIWSVNPSATPNFVNYGTALDRPTVLDEPISLATKVGLDDKMPLNAIGLPFYKEFLASKFPSDMIFTKELSRVPQKHFPEQIAVVAAATTGTAATATATASSASASTMGAAAQKNPNISLPPLQPYDKNRMGPRNVILDYEALQAAHPRFKAGMKPTKGSKFPKFLSEREREMTTSPILSNREFEPVARGNPLQFETQENDLDAGPNNGAGDDEVDGLNDSVFQHKSSHAFKPPPCYERLEIRYSKFGVDDFDFDYYNRSQGAIAGLENHLDNSYVNSLLQVYRFTPIFYNMVTSSLLHEYLPNDENTIMNKHNTHGSSILNELAYLFDMMHNAGSRNVSISNFSSVLNESSIAKTYELLNSDDGKSLDGRRLQQLLITFNKFLVESVVNDYQTQFGINVQDLTATHYRLDFTSPTKELLNSQVGNQATLDLVTPPRYILNKGSVGASVGSAGAGGAGGGVSRFSNVNTYKKNNNLLTYLNYSLNQQRIIQASSNPANQNPSPVEVKQTLLNVGPVLLINLPFSEQELEMIKSYKNWLVPEFYTTKITDNAVIFKPVVTHFNHHASSKFELQGFVCEVLVGLTASTGQHNIVSFVKVNSPALGIDQWFLFNDFLVMPLPEKEVFDLTPAWKKPLVLVYVNVDDSRNHEFTYFERSTFSKLLSLDQSILYRDHFACEIRNGMKREYELLSENEETPEFGSLVAIDAEFVSMKAAITELSYTGTKTLVRPALLSLARISALRGNFGDKNFGKAFIDDYIVHTKPIHDYLTTFSGIEDGDLDPERSKKSLVTLQTAYRRLWLLSNMGCVFVGHGLKSDFRCINLQVPKSQIRDTAEFYYLPEHRRKLSLKFLAFCVLGCSVQTNNHDSIEDAYTALLLYQKYMELQNSGDFEATLNRIYNEGQQLRFRAPEAI